MIDNMGIAIMATATDCAGQAANSLGNGAGGVFARAFVGGMAANISGGDFGDGFVSAGLTAWLLPGPSEGFNGLEFMRNMVVGGTISRATGGKFANGAFSAAFSYTVAAGAQKDEIGELQNSGNNNDPRGKNPHTIDGSRPLSKNSFSAEKLGEIDGRIKTYSDKYKGTTKGSEKSTAVFLSQGELVDISLEYNIEIAVVIGSDGTIRDINTNYNYRAVNPSVEFGQSLWHTHPYSDGFPSGADMHSAAGDDGWVFSTNGDGTTWGQNGVNSNIYDAEASYSKIPINNVVIYSRGQWREFKNLYASP